MGNLLEGFKIDFEHILEKRGKLFMRGYHSREDTN
jgi:hypothetical protein